MAVLSFPLCSSEGSLHSSDSVSDSSPPPAVVQTGVPTQVVQQVQTAQQVNYSQSRTHKHNMKYVFPLLLKLPVWSLSLFQQRSVVQATAQIAKTEPGTQLSVTSLQPVHISPEVSPTYTYSNTIHQWRYWWWIYSLIIWQSLTDHLYCHSTHLLNTYEQTVIHTNCHRFHCKGESLLTHLNLTSLIFWSSVSQLCASAGFQLLPTTGVTALARDKNLEEWQQHHEIGQPECLAWASADYRGEYSSKPLFLPLDLVQYYQSLHLFSMHAEKEIGAHPEVTSSGPDQSSLLATTSTFQVGQGQKGDCCCRVKGTKKSVTKNYLLRFIIVGNDGVHKRSFLGR